MLQLLSLDRQERDRTQWLSSIVVRSYVAMACMNILQGMLRAYYASYYKRTTEENL